MLLQAAVPKREVLVDSEWPLQFHAGHRRSSLVKCISLRRRAVYTWDGSQVHMALARIANRLDETEQK